MNYTDLDLAILKSITNNKRAALDFTSECDPKLFSTDVWNFAKLITGYIKTYKEVPTLRILEDQLAKGNNDKQAEYVRELWKVINAFSYDEKQFKFDLTKLKNRYAEKQIAQFQDTISKNTDKIDVAKTMQEMQKVMQNIKSLETYSKYESVNIKDYLPTFVSNFNLRKENPNIDNGIMTKYSAFDFATNGAKPADFLLIAGESGFGKSLFLNNIAVQVWMQDNTIDSVEFKNGHDIIYFSLEMPYEDCFNRLLSRLSGVPARAIEKSKLTKEEFIKVKKCLDFIKRYPYQFKIVDVTDVSANEIEKIFLESEENFKVMFIDYLGIMKTNDKSEESDWLKQGMIAYEVRAIARKYKIPIFSAVQLNRKSGGKDSGEQIGLHRLARSSSIATHATHVIQIENRQNEEQYPDFIYHFIKNRKGSKLKSSLIKNLSCATLIDNPQSSSEEDSYNNFFTDQDDISEDMGNLDI